MKGKVFNWSRVQVEKATMKRCPRCHGAGGVFGDTRTDKVCICHGYSELWISDDNTGWVRAKYAKLENSELY